MATLKDIKRRINSIRSTSKITRAMKMVSAAKLRRAQDSMFALRPYSDKIRDVLGALSYAMDIEHPLLEVRPRQTIEVLILTSDKGLCGAFNSNVIRQGVALLKRLEREGFQVSLSVIGRKARDYFRRRNIQMRRVWTGLSGKVTYSSAKDIAYDITENYINETFDELYLVYNEFKSVIAQRVVEQKLLPIRDVKLEEAPTLKDFLFEPSEKEVFSRLLPRSIEILIYRAMLESQASEEAARMTAMENATKNAEDMIDRLTLEYNKARQASITAELMDIVGGAEALKE